ncbi:MAG: hypothetical protein Q4B64_02700 [Spirochaetales bacterium]|nr:hypothetical protein [Spirochaetales bacterium]
MDFNKHELQTLLRCYRKIDSRTEHSLNRMGFNVERQKTHVILSYWVNGRKLIFTVAKTSSDYRAGRNLASVIYNQIYQATFMAA